jgi:hypothetical protein
MNEFWMKDIMDMEIPTCYELKDGELVNLGKLVVDKSLNKKEKVYLYEPPKYYGNVYTAILMQGLVYKHFFKDYYESLV